MILRSVTQHVKDQNWFAVFLDFFIVVVGVFVGIQVSNWDQERKDTALAADYVERIKVDISDQIEQFQLVKAYYETTHQYGKSADQAFQQADESLTAGFLIDLFQTSQYINVSFIDSTYNELMSTGRVVNIKNKQIRNLITSYYHRMVTTQVTINEINPYRRVIRLYMDTMVQDQILENCGDVYIMKNETTFAMALPEQCDIAFDEKLVVGETSALKANQQVRTELRFHLTVLKAKLSSLKNAIGIATSTLAKIEAAQL